MTESFYADVPLEKLVPTRHNPRAFREDDPAVRELAASIRAHGILQPVVGRPHPNQEDRYELLAGARRLAAARLAGLDRIPAIIKMLSDEEALEVTLIENLLRVDLTPLEEAQGIQTCLDHGWEPRAIADHMGKSTAWVSRRARLTQLSPSWKERVRDPGDPVSTWPAANLELVARLDPDQQDTFAASKAAWIRKRDLRTSELERVLANLRHDLDRALWDLDDATLVPEAARCTICPKRSSLRPSLFPELESPEAGDQCLDPECWRRKLVAYVLEVQRVLEKEHGRVVPVRDGDKPAPDLLGDGVRDVLDFQRSRAGTRGAVPVLYVSGDRAGTWFWGKAVEDEPEEEQEEDIEPGENQDRRHEIARDFAAAHMALMLVGNESCSFRHRSTAMGWTGMDTLALIAMRRVLKSDGMPFTVAQASVHNSMLIHGAKLMRRDDCLNVICAMAVHAELREKGCLEVPPEMVGLHVDSVLFQEMAKSFTVSRSFLSAHDDADLARVVSDLGVQVPEAAGRKDLVELTMMAGLPPGTLTPELAQAFRVPYARPAGTLRLAGARLSEIREAVAQIRRGRETRARGPAFKK